VTCEQAIRTYEACVQELGERFLELAAEHTADEQLQERVVRELWRLARKAEKK